jgi:hypothetical protein
MKNITVCIATTGAFSDIAIAPGTTPRDIKAQLQLDEKYVLTRGKGTEPIPDGENLYESISEGTKLFAATEITVGGL